MRKADRPTDHRNISLRQLNLDFIHGKSNGRVLWQPRILCWYEDRIFRQEPLPAPYTGMSPVELYRALGCSNRIYDIGRTLEKIEDESIRRHSEYIDAFHRKDIIETPIGSVYQIVRSNSSNYGEYQEKWYVEDEDDLKVMIYVEEHSTWVFDEQLFREVEARWGDIGEPGAGLPRISVQKLFHELTGVENGIYALIDYPDVCEAYFKAKHDQEIAFCKLLCDTPMQWANFGDNIHCALLPPNLFEKYVLPEYQARMEVLRKGGIYGFAHWDGDTKTLLKYAKETNLHGIEAITPVPQGDVTIEEIKAGLGDTVDLIDGIPALLFTEDYPVSQLKETTQKLIDLFAGHLILGISDEMPSNGDIGRIEIVGEIVDDHNARCQ